MTHSRNMSSPGYLESLLDLRAAKALRGGLLLHCRREGGIVRLHTKQTTPSTHKRSDATIRAAVIILLARRAIDKTLSTENSWCCINRHRCCQSSNDSEEGETHCW